MRSSGLSERDVIRPGAEVHHQSSSANVLSLLYPQSGLAGYSREGFLEDLVREAEKDIRNCLQVGAACAQIDLTEGCLALKLDPFG
jgi:5-methyltetrahydropteroyltriglutamate--homocysteine methyltransferase